MNETPATAAGAVHSRDSNCGIRSAVFYGGAWLHPNSDAYRLLMEKKITGLQAHMKQLRRDAVNRGEIPS